jgi:uncharacterized protein (DUF4415 family)
MSDANTGKTVKFTLAGNTPLRAQARAELAALQHRKVDYSDIPPSPADAHWTRLGVPLSPENKRQITLRLDVDVIDFFRATGERYQTRINHILREYMQDHTG